MLSKTILIGNVGKDPEIKVLNSTTLAKLSIATSEKYKDKQGATVNKTEWHNITAWGKLAEIIEKYVKKGALLYVEGVLHYSSSGEGDQKRYFTEIKIDQMKMIGKSESNDRELRPAEPDENSSSDGADDLPF